MRFGSIDSYTSYRHMSPLCMPLPDLGVRISEGRERYYVAVVAPCLSTAVVLTVLTLA